jgi:hypothetical protein
VLSNKPATPVGWKSKTHKARHNVHQNAARSLSQPGSPLRVAVYSRIAEAIRNGLLTPGSMIPTETELGADMKVSRTLVQVTKTGLGKEGFPRNSNRRLHLHSGRKADLEWRLTMVGGSFRAS